MSLSSDDTPTGPIVGARQAAAGPPGAAAGPHGGPNPQAPGHLARMRNIKRDVAATALLILAPLFPWNLYFGVGIPASDAYLGGFPLTPLLWMLLAVATLLSLISIAVSLGRLNPGRLAGLRLFLNIPYLVLVAGFVVYDVFDSIRSGGTVHIPGGVGPGGWLGVAGALLAAQPPLIRAAADEDSYHRWLRGARVVGYASMFGASLAAGFNLCWRVRYAVQGISGAEEFGTRNITVILTAVVYGAVALAAVLVASRWILRNTAASRFATLALGVSALLAGIIVWLLPAGREIDSFHGIAQNTSTAGVGYEGYLAWVAAAAIFVPLTWFSPPEIRRDREIWRNAIRKGLALIIVWSFGSVLMRLTDLAVAVMLNYPYSRYDTMTLAVFDATTAVLALWLRIKLTDGPLRSRLITTLSGLVFALAVSRVILGVLLAPRFEQPPDALQNPVYGNSFAQQITSTFDVTLCGLALCIFAAISVAARLRKPRRRPPRQRPAPSPTAVPSRPGRVPVPTRPGGPPAPSEARTTQFGAARTDHNAPTTVLSGPASPRIFRPSEPSGPLRPKIYRPQRGPDNPQGR